MISQILVQLFKTRHAENGDRGNSAELTVYALLALKRLTSLPWSLEVSEMRDAAIALK